MLPAYHMLPDAISRRLVVWAPACLALTLLADVPATAQPLLLEFRSPTEITQGGFGSSVSTVPDTDGDGVTDLLVGTGTSTGTGEQKVYLFSGATGALLHTLTDPGSGNPASYFGRSVSGVPDIDGDGRGDLLVGAERAGPSQFLAYGKAYLFSGSSGLLLRTMDSPNSEHTGEFGRTVAGIPDVNSDGFGDIIVGAWLENPGTSLFNAGRAYLFSGADGALLFELTSPNEEESGYFGSSVASVPDTDGDAMGDLLIGALNEGPGASPDQAGRAYLFSGSTGLLLHELASTNEELGGMFGTSVAGVPDADGDGRGDLLVGAEMEDPGTSPDWAGRAYLFSGATGLFLRELASPNEDQRGAFGNAVAGVPDADGDGRGDLLVGAFGEGGGPFNAIGRAYLFSGADGTLLYNIASPNGGGEFGVSVAGTPDIDGDGRGDLFIGARAEGPTPSPSTAGRAYLFRGAAGSAFSLTATALTSLSVPPGGSIQFQFTASNGTGNPASGDLFFTARVGSNQVAAGRILSGAIQPGESITSTFTQAVPGNAPPGSYIYDLTIGQFPSVTAATETFIVTVAAARASGESSETWTVRDVEPWHSHRTTATAPPSAVTLESAYPNPFADQSTLGFDLPKAEHVRLTAYDVLGREVAVLADGIAEAGRHEVVFDPTGLPNGVYLMRLEAGGTVETQHMTVLR